MKFGVGIMGSEPSSKIIETIRIVEKLGYDFVWIPDEKFYRDVYAMLTLCALNTKNVRIGTCVTDPYIRSPVVTAAAIATIAEMSKGRAVLGIGAGAQRHLRSVGLAAKKPVQAIREAVEVIRLLLHRPQSAIGYKGETLRLENVKLDFECGYTIPIYVAGRGPKTLEMAGEVGDGVIIGALSSSEGLKYALGHIEKGAQRASRNIGKIDIVSWTYCSVGYDIEVTDSVKPIIASSVYNSRDILKDIGLDWEITRPIIEAVDNYRGPTREAFKRASKHVSKELQSSFSIAGTPKECRSKVEELVSMGINQIAILPYPEKEKGRKNTIELFAKEVLDKLDLKKVK
jgi:5,10-methylenetetrahydromethanopterin reductase